MGGFEEERGGERGGEMARTNLNELATGSGG